MKKITLLSLLLLITIPTIAQVSIPDVNFETELIAQGIDTDGLVNGQISTADALAKTGTLNVSSKSITDLTGIEAFTNITRLNCEFNNLNALNISALTGLLRVRCKNNNISTLNVSSNTLLTRIWAQNNDITAINTVSNSNLQQLRVQNNDLTVLDVSSNSNLIQLRCQGNNLTELNAKTGNNTNMTFFIANNNPSLACIEVDDITYADANFTKDATATFSTDCSTLSNLDFDLTQDLSIYPNPTSNSIVVSSASNITSLKLYNLLGELIMVVKNRNKLDLSNLNSGIYLVNIQTEKGKITKKVIKN